MTLVSRDRHITVGDLCDAGLGLLPKSFTFEVLSASYSAFGALLMRIIVVLQREAWSVSGLNRLARYSSDWKVTPYCIVVWSSNDTFAEADWLLQNLSRLNVTSLVSIKGTIMSK
jgi:hypothetical protein